MRCPHLTKTSAVRASPEAPEYSVSAILYAARISIIPMVRYMEHMMVDPLVDNEPLNWPVVMAVPNDQQVGPGVDVGFYFPYAPPRFSLALFVQRL